MSDYSHLNMTGNANNGNSTNNFSEQRQFLHQNPHEQFAASQLNMTQPANMVFSQLNSLLQNGLSVGTNSFHGIPTQQTQQTMRSPTLQSFSSLQGGVISNAFPGDFSRPHETFQQGMAKLPLPLQFNGIEKDYENSQQVGQRFDSFTGSLKLPSHSGQGNVQPVRFGGELKAGQLPKLIALAEAPNNGSIHLYEITKASILMVTNPPNMSINLQGLIRTDKSYDTPHGPKTGYMFYKNRPEHLVMIDQLFPGSGWREQLVEAIPPPQEKKDPFLLWEGFLNYSNIDHSTYLYEYSDKSLALFTTVELGDQLPKCRLQCPHLGKTEMGYNAYKNKAEHINFLKNILKIPVDFESKYTKSVPKAAKIERDPIRIFHHPFVYNGVSYEIEVYEYSELSVAVFTTPMFPISGLTLTEGLTHPTQGRRPGMMISKKNDAHMTILKNYINKNDLETLYVMEQQKSSRGDIINSFGPATSATSSTSAGQNVQSIPRSYEDIPIDTLVRLLRVNLDKEPNEVYTKDLIGNEMMVIGEKTQVLNKLELFIDAKIKVDVTIGNKKLVIINLEE